MAVIILVTVGLAYHEGRRNERLLGEVRRALDERHVLEGHFVQLRKQDEYTRRVVSVATQNEISWVDRWSEEQMKVEDLQTQLAGCHQP